MGLGGLGVGGLAAPAGAAASALSNLDTSSKLDQIYSGVQRVEEEVSGVDTLVIALAKLLLDVAKSIGTRPGGTLPGSGLGLALSELQGAVGGLSMSDFMQYYAYTIVPQTAGGPWEVTFGEAAWAARNFLTENDYYLHPLASAPAFSAFGNRSAFGSPVGDLGSVSPADKGQSETVKDFLTRVVPSITWHETAGGFTAWGVVPATDITDSWIAVYTPGNIGGGQGQRHTYVPTSGGDPRDAVTDALVLLGHMSALLGWTDGP